MISEVGDGVCNDPVTAADCKVCIDASAAASFAPSTSVPSPRLIDEYLNEQLLVEMDNENPLELVAFPARPARSWECRLERSYAWPRTKEEQRFSLIGALARSAGSASSRYAA